MDAGRAYALGVAWESVHLVLVILVVPAAFLAKVWLFLRSEPIHQWKVSSIVLAWLVVPIVWLFEMMSESMLSETVLSIYEPPVVTMLYCIYGLLTLMILAGTVLWLVRRPVLER